MNVWSTNYALAKSTQILSHYYFYVNINISNESFNLYLFKRVTFVMPVNIAQWHAGIGRFHSRIIIQKTENSFSDLIIFKCMLTFFCNLFISIFLLRYWTNPGPKKNSHSYFPCCHCNVNSLATDNYSKVLALKTYNSTYKYDFISISETFLDSSFEPDDKDVMLDDYNLIRSDHPSNTKRVVFVFIIRSLSQYV